MVLVSWLMILLARDGQLDRLEAGTFLVAMASFLAYAVWVARRQTGAPDRVVIAEEIAREAGWLKGRSVLLMIAGLAASFALLALGARLLVQGAVDVALHFGLSERIVGLTVVAIGTSLPELVATLAAVLKREHEMAVTNVVGSNVFNVLMILGASGLVRPIPVAGSLIVPDMAVMMALTVLLFPLVAWDQRLERRDGAVLVVVYAGYMLWLILA
jgi:cation:H+ antiporter